MPKTRAGHIPFWCALSGCMRSASLGCEFALFDWTVPFDLECLGGLVWQYGKVNQLAIIVPLHWAALLSPYVAQAEELGKLGLPTCGR